MYDAIVIGARCAGSPTAMLLAQKGYKVLLLDKTEFPSDTISTHIIWPPAAAQLKTWNLLDEVIASNSPVINKVALDVGPFFLKGSPAVNGAPAVIAPRRTVLDKILVDAAVKAGAEIWENTLVEEILIENGSVTGIRCRTKSSASTVVKSKVVIGADGRYSIVAHTVMPEEYISRPSLTCWYYTYWDDLNIDELTFYSPPGRGVAAIPTNNGQTCIPVVWPADEFNVYRSDIEGNYLKTLDQCIGLSDIIHKAKRAEKFFGIADVPNYFRQSFGPGWALVGDAAYNKDPITGQGINDAFYGAVNLTHALDSVFSGRESWEDALANYQKNRDDKVMPMFEFTLDFALLKPPTKDMEFLFLALRDNPSETDRFIGTIAGSVSIPEFYSPDNLQKIISSLEGQE